jgi:hypothetical protein
MKKTFLIINSFLMFLFMACPAFSQNPATPKEKEQSAVASPSITFYYFDQ